MEFIECNIKITMNNISCLSEYGEWLLLKCEINGEIEYGVLHYGTTSNNKKLGIYDGHFLYDFADVLTIKGYMVIE